MEGGYFRRRPVNKNRACFRKSDECVRVCVCVWRVRVPMEDMYFAEKV